MAKKRNGRQDAIRDIVRNKDVRTQRVLVDELRAMGFDCTQATVSRDIADMGLRKLPEGIYVLAEDLHLQRMVSELVTGVLRTDNLVMIKAQPGTASGIAPPGDAGEAPHVGGLLARPGLPAPPPPLMRQSCPMCLARLPATIRFWLLPRRPRTASVLRR